MSQSEFGYRDLSIELEVSIVKLIHFSFVPDLSFTASRHNFVPRHKTNCDGVGIREIRFITSYSANLCANYEASQVIYVASLCH